MAEVNPLSKSMCEVEHKKPIDVLREDMAELKSELYHIKTYLRKLEARESLKEDNEKKIEAEYQKVEKGWWW